MRALTLLAVSALVMPVGAGAATLRHGATAAGEGPTVSMSFAAFAPTSIRVLAGTTVTWRNASPRAHTVTAEDASFGSRRLEPGAEFARRFDAVGPAAYYCRLHSFMRGSVEVHRVLLDAPREPTAPRKPYVLTGRAALESGAEVSIQADTGEGFREVTSTTVADGGTIHAEVTPNASATYRAVAGPDASPAVSLLVLDRKVSATASTRGRRAIVKAVVTPASPGATVVLQLRLRHRFGWWPVARVAAGKGGRATFRIPIGRRVPARVVLTLADGATRLATSRTLTVGR